MGGHFTSVGDEDGVRSMLVAREFKGGDKDRDDLLAASTTIESKRMLFSRAATHKNGKSTRESLFTYEESKFKFRVQSCCVH